MSVAAAEAASRRREYKILPHKSFRALGRLWLKEEGSYEEGRERKRQGRPRRRSREKKTDTVGNVAAAAAVAAETETLGIEGGGGRYNITAAQQALVQG